MRKSGERVGFGRGTLLRRIVLFQLEDAAQRRKVRVEGVLRLFERAILRPRRAEEALEEAPTHLQSPLQVW